jgi:hypothetical protein
MKAEDAAIDANVGAHQAARGLPAAFRQLPARQAVLHHNVREDFQNPSVFRFRLFVPVLLVTEFSLKQFGAPCFVKPPQGPIRLSEWHRSKPSLESRSGVRGKTPLPRLSRHLLLSISSVEDPAVGNCAGNPCRKCRDTVVPFSGARRRKGLSITTTLRSTGSAPPMNLCHGLPAYFAVTANLRRSC